MGPGCYWKSPKFLGSNALRGTDIYNYEETVISSLYLNMSALVKPVYTFIKGVCPIYAHDTGEYVGSAFLICDINYLCHYPEVEGRARATHHYFFFLLCLMCRGPGPFCRSMAALGFNSQLQRDLQRFQFDLSAAEVAWLSARLLGGPKGLEGLT